jgi:hypothetical protein
MINLIVSPGSDLYVTEVVGSGSVPRPPGEGWTLASVATKVRSVRFLAGNTYELREESCSTFYWTRSRVTADAEREAEKIALGLALGDRA